MEANCFLFSYCITALSLLCQHFSGVREAYMSDFDGTSSSPHANFSHNSANESTCLFDLSQHIEGVVEPIKRIHPGHVPAETCGVCGNAADGYHYDAASCNSCKTFFRRSIIAEKRYTCKKDRRCLPLTSKSRLFCRACRFQKCLDIGMNPLAIQTDTSNSVIESFVRKRKAEDPILHPCTSKELATIDQQRISILDSLLYLEMKAENMRKGNFSPNPLGLPTLRELLRTNVNLDADFVKVKKCICMQMPSQIWSKQDGRYVFCPYHRYQTKHWLIVDLYLIIEYAKTFPFFHKLKEDDQVALLKGVCLLCNDHMQAYFSYDNKSDVVIHPDGTNVMRKLKFDSNHRKVRVPIEKRELIAPLIRDKITKEEYVLLKAILLCNPAVSNLSSDGVEIVEKERANFSSLLLTFCKSKFGAHGVSRFASIIAMSDILENSAQKTRDIHFFLKLFRSAWKRIRLVEDIME